MPQSRSVRPCSYPHNQSQCPNAAAVGIDAGTRMPVLTN